jgi:hypothetical protein
VEENICIGICKRLCFIHLPSFVGKICGARTFHKNFLTDFELHANRHSERYHLFEDVNENFSRIFYIFRPIAKKIGTGDADNILLSYSELRERRRS